MPRFTLLALLIASGLACAGVSEPRQSDLSAHETHTLARSTRLLCSFKTGPLAGRVQILAPSVTLKPGDPCTDGGSTGEVIVTTAPSQATTPDWWEKIRERYNPEEYQRQYPDRPTTAQPPPSPPAPSTGQLPSGAATGASGVGTGAGSATPAKRPTPRHGTTSVNRSPAGTEPPVIAPSTGSSGSSTAAPAPDEVQQVHLWYEGLQKGSAKYHVPPDMVLGQTYSATAVIHPPTSPTPAAPDAHPLKMSPYMRIVLNQTANPGTFEIKPEGNDCKFVSMDADTTWVFDVKPLLPGKDRVLDFAAYVVYGTGDATCKPENLKTIDVLSDTERVTIAAITPRKAWQDIVVSFITDPTKWFKFILPGGLGFAAIKWLYSWWKKRKSARIASTQPQHTP